MPWKKDANGNWGNFADDLILPKKISAEQAAEVDAVLDAVLDDFSFDGTNTSKTSNSVAASTIENVTIEDVTTEDVTTEDVTIEDIDDANDARNNKNNNEFMVEQKRAGSNRSLKSTSSQKSSSSNSQKSRTSSRSQKSQHHYYNHGEGNPNHGEGNPSAVPNHLDDEDSRSLSSMSMLFRKARGGRYKEEPKQQSSDYANYQFDDDATVDSLSDIFGKTKKNNNNNNNKSKVGKGETSAASSKLQKHQQQQAKTYGDAPKPTTTLLGPRSDDWNNDDDDILAGIIGDVANLHEQGGRNDQFDSIEPENVVDVEQPENVVDVEQPDDDDDVTTVVLENIAAPAHSEADDIADGSNLLNDLEESALLEVELEEREDDAKETTFNDISFTLNTTADTFSLGEGSSAKNSSSLRKKKTRSSKRGGSMSNKRMCCWIFGSVITIAVVVVAFFQIYYKIQRKNNQSIGDFPAVAPEIQLPPTRSPLPEGHTAEPTMTVSPTESPTLRPTLKPTTGPTENYIDPLMEFLQDNQVSFEMDPFSPDFMAVQWLADEAQYRVTEGMGVSSGYGNGLELTDKLIQRFALLTLDFGLLRADAPYATKLVRNKIANTVLNEQYTSFELETYARSNTIAVKYQDECHWVGVHCATVGAEAGKVMEINFAGEGLTGTIPPEIKLFKNLKRLDLSNNDLRGSIPDSIYKIRELEELYLYQNRLTGTISKNIENWWNITRLHLSHNELSGSIPITFKSGDVEIRPIEYLNLYSNKFTGTIPHNMRLRRLKFADFGRNQFRGALPEEIGDKWVELRFLYLDHNEFTGTIPYSYPSTGNGRIEAMTFNDNSLTGWVPGHFYQNKLLEFNVQNNQFTGIGWDVCKQAVFDSGEMVEYKADCDICNCSPFCENQCEEETKPPKRKN